MATKTTKTTKKPKEKLKGLLGIASVTITQYFDGKPSLYTAITTKGTKITMNPLEIAIRAASDGVDFLSGSAEMLACVAAFASDKAEEKPKKK